MKKVAMMISLILGIHWAFYYLLAAAENNADAMHHRNFISLIHKQTTTLLTTIKHKLSNGNYKQDFNHYWSYDTISECLMPNVRSFR